MSYYYLQTSNDHLAHHGILGMRWGIRRYQPYPKGKKGRFLGEKQAKKARTSNVEAWGKDGDHNTLYITGVSGSGKSTLARDLASGDNAEVIHLDLYTEEYDKGWGEGRSKAFDKHLGETVPNFKSLNKSGAFSSKKERFKVIDAVGDQIEMFSRKMYDEGKRVIVEGVELSDETLFPDKTYFKNKPTVILNTNSNLSAVRSVIRDSKRNAAEVDGLFDKVKSYALDTKIVMSSLSERKRWYDYFGRKMDDLANVTNAETGSTYLLDYLTRKEVEHSK